MTEQYRFNPSCAEQRTPRDVLRTLPKADRKAFKTMTYSEVAYLTIECGINDYIKYLRKGKEGLVASEEFPVLIIKGTPLQLDRFRVTFLISLIDYQGTRVFYPAQFSLGEEVLEDFRTFAGVAIVKIPKNASTSEGLDEHRTELIASLLPTRRDLFNPTIILAEESIAGKLNISNNLTKVIILDKNKLRGDYEDNTTEYVDTTASRVKTVYNISNNAYSGGRSVNTTEAPAFVWKDGKKTPWDKLSVNDKNKWYKEGRI